MSKTKEKEDTTSRTVEEAPLDISIKTVEPVTIDSIYQQLQKLNETLYRCGQILAAIDDRLAPQVQQTPNMYADSNRPLSNKPQWSSNVSGGW